MDSVETAFAEFKANGLKKEISDFDIEQQGDAFWKVFYIVAPDNFAREIYVHANEPIRSDRATEKH